MRGAGLSRRRLLQLAAVGAAAAALPVAERAAGAADEAAQEASQLSDHEALAYEKLSGLRVRCKLCPRECTVPNGQRGHCRVRRNQGGVYRTLVYARPCALQKDPIEKKPLFHFLPGTYAFSIATAGCNVECQFCQNWRISQFPPEEVESTYCPPDAVAELAVRSDCRTIAYTYSEPVVFYEYMLDCAREGNKKGVRSVMISNGYINPEPMRALCKELAAVKVDLKAFTDDFYRDTVRGDLQGVLETLKLLKELGMHNEIVVLLIPGLNDAEDEVRKMSDWMVQNLGRDVPMHFTRFRPAYKMTNLEPTPVRTLERARQAAVGQGVHYAYVGNVPGHQYEHTFCHQCGKKVIGRYGYRVLETHLAGGRCEFCGTSVPGVWQ